MPSSCDELGRNAADGRKACREPPRCAAGDDIFRPMRHDGILTAARDYRAIAVKSMHRRSRVAGRQKAICYSPPAERKARSASGNVMLAAARK